MGNVLLFVVEKKEKEIIYVYAYKIVKSGARKV